MKVLSLTLAIVSIFTSSISANALFAQYKVLDINSQCKEPSVKEFFAYQCPHCLQLERYLYQWKTSNETIKQAFEAIPTDLGKRDMGSYIYVHNAAKKLGILPKAQALMFKRYHEDKQTFKSKNEALEFLVAVGAKKEEAIKALDDSGYINDQNQNYMALLKRYKISSVPTIVVNDRYYIDVKSAGGFDKVTKVIEETMKLTEHCQQETASLQ